MSDNIISEETIKRIRNYFDKQIKESKLYDSSDAPYAQNTSLDKLIDHMLNQLVNMKLRLNGMQDVYNQYTSDRHALLQKAKQEYIDQYSKSLTFIEAAKKLQNMTITEIADLLNNE